MLTTPHPCQRTTLSVQKKMQNKELWMKHLQTLKGLTCCSMSGTVDTGFWDVQFSCFSYYFAWMGSTDLICMQHCILRRKMLKKTVSLALNVQLGSKNWHFPPSTAAGPPGRWIVKFSLLALWLSGFLWQISLISEMLSRDCCCV